MGWVTQLRISGDNDEPIFPVRYYMHYAYCQQCGSFNMTPWQETRKRLRQQQNFLGVRCVDCDTTYAYGSTFFADRTDNPRAYTMADVPLPLNRNYQERGEILGPADE